VAYSILASKWADVRQNLGTAAPEAYGEHLKAWKAICGSRYVCVDMTSPSGIKERFFYMCRLKVERLGSSVKPGFPGYMGQPGLHGREIVVSFTMQTQTTEVENVTPSFGKQQQRPSFTRAPRGSSPDGSLFPDRCGVEAMVCPAPCHRAGSPGGIL
jgi:hypothetical protein